VHGDPRRRQGLRAAACPLLLRVAVGGRHRRLARCSVEDVITGRCVWIFAFGASFLHLGIRTSIWACILAFGDS
jgi:hypothetical protein